LVAPSDVADVVLGLYILQFVVGMLGIWLLLQWFFGQGSLP